eukprot:6572016-Alexandrium_andersonii.AAC.1
MRVRARVSVCPRVSARARVCARTCPRVSVCVHVYARAQSAFLSWGRASLEFGGEVLSLRLARVSPTVLVARRPFG